MKRRLDHAGYVVSAATVDLPLARGPLALLDPVFSCLTVGTGLQPWASVEKKRVFSPQFLPCEHRAGS